MNTENTTTEEATHIKVEKESDDEEQSEINLYADHEIKEEIVIGPEVLQQVYATNCCEDSPVAKKIKLEEKDEKPDQVQPKNEIIEDNTEEIISNVDKSEKIKVKTEEQNTLRKYNQTPGIICNDCDSPVAKKIKLEEKNEKPDQVEPKKEIIEDNTEEIISNLEINNKIKVKTKEQNTIRKYNQTPGIICNDCGKKFRKICELAKHIVCHEKIKQDNNYKCKECTYQTGSQVSLEQHSKLHDIDRIFTSKHSLLNDGPKVKEYLCSVCEYVSPTKSYLEQHLRTHTGEKPYSCTECNYRGASKNSLTRHLRIHNIKKQYSCSKCKYECYDKSAILRHMHTHTDKKTISCSECEYKCANKYYLRKHSRVHSGENPYLCSVCKYGCGDKNTLAIHLRTHTNEKPFSCSECDYKCANKSYLKVHLRTHTGEKPYSCSKCRYKCADKSAMSKHLRTSHRCGDKP